MLVCGKDSTLALRDTLNFMSALFETLQSIPTVLHIIALLTKVRRRLIVSRFIAQIARATYFRNTANDTSVFVAEEFLHRHSLFRATVSSCKVVLWADALNWKGGIDGNSGN